ncbi:hypothetical protein AAG570_011698 [Ranatra chinensis]|uniref:Uncharacterized protein n=1 Tax=Ranatra chinensis TaxID=642074 RepID=A0ABD0YGV0_9HEMI
MKFCSTFEKRDITGEVEVSGGVRGDREGDEGNAGRWCGGNPVTLRGAQQVFPVVPGDTATTPLLFDVFPCFFPPLLIGDIINRGDRVGLGDEHFSISDTIGDSFLPNGDNVLISGLVPEGNVCASETFFALKPLGEIFLEGVTTGHVQGFFGVDCLVLTISRGEVLEFLLHSSSTSTLDDSFSLHSPSEKIKQCPILIHDKSSDVTQYKHALCL